MLISPTTGGSNQQIRDLDERTINGKWGPVKPGDTMMDPWERGRITDRVVNDDQMGLVHYPTNWTWAWRIFRKAGNKSIGWTSQNEKNYSRHSIRMNNKQATEG